MIISSYCLDSEIPVFYSTFLQSKVIIYLKQTFQITFKEKVLLHVKYDSILNKKTINSFSGQE